MAQKNFQDEWGTGAREGYEDRGTSVRRALHRKNPAARFYVFLARSQLWVASAGERTW